MRKTKIVCTIGPSTNSEEKLKELICAGMNVARLNTSHEGVEVHSAMIDRIKKVRKELNRPVSILMDLSGPKIRTGIFNEEHVTLNEGDEFVLTTEKIVGNEKRVSINYSLLPVEVKKGNIILVDDGKLELEVMSSDDKNIYTKIINGGTITHRRGVNIPGIEISIPAITEKDKLFIKLGIDKDVDYFAMSFVRTSKDVKLAKDTISEMGSDIPLISKIETKQALDYLEEICELSDGIMVARGDLGVEINVEEVPMAQRKIIYCANRERIPVITATQMLESMIDNPVPTRAEITDISNAIIEGTDAIMLSGETSIGKYPVEAVKVMVKTSLATEKYLIKRSDLQSWVREGHKAENITEAICEAVWKTSEKLNIKIIISSTYSGYTAINVSGFKPNMPILAITPNERTYYRLPLIWGVFPMLHDIGLKTDEILSKVKEKAIQENLLQKGDLYIFTAGIPFGKTKSTNLLTIESV